MDFEYSEKTQELSLRVKKFMQDNIYPNEPVFAAQVAEGDRWAVVPILETSESQSQRRRSVEFISSRK